MSVSTTTQNRTADGGEEGRPNMALLLADVLPYVFDFLPQPQSTIVHKVSLVCKTLAEAAKDPEFYKTVNVNGRWFWLYLELCNLLPRPQFSELERLTMPRIELKEDQAERIAKLLERYCRSLSYIDLGGITFRGGRNRGSQAFLTFMQCLPKKLSGIGVYSGIHQGYSLQDVLRVVRLRGSDLKELSIDCRGEGRAALDVAMSQMTEACPNLQVFISKGFPTFEIIFEMADVPNQFVIRMLQNCKFLRVLQLDSTFPLNEALVQRMTEIPHVLEDVKFHFKSNNRSVGFVYDSSDTDEDGSTRHALRALDNRWVEEAFPSLRRSLRRLRVGTPDNRREEEAARTRRRLRIGTSDNRREEEAARTRRRLRALDDLRRELDATPARALRTLHNQILSNRGLSNPGTG